MTIILCSWIMLFLVFNNTSLASDVYMQHGEVFFYEPKSYSNQLNIFCYRGRPKYLIYLWQSVFLQLNHSSDDYKSYEGTSSDLVKKEFDEDKYSWAFNMFSFKQNQYKLNPFNQSCVGIKSLHSYTVSLNIVHVDYWKIILLVTGIMLFFISDKLSRNAIFYYVCGIALGIFTSFLILIYFLTNFLPKKSLMVGVTLCGWTIGIYILQLLWENIRIICLQYKSYLAMYMLTSGLLSFIVCYRWGPMEQQRTQKLIQWFLQILALIGIFLSTEIPEAAVCEIVLLLLFYMVPYSWMAKWKQFWNGKFPPKVRMLTNDEYYEQGARETTKALHELRSYCSSPECKQWNVALKLKDIKRFASFVEGNSHLSDDEVLQYESLVNFKDLTDNDLTEEDDP